MLKEKKDKEKDDALKGPDLWIKAFFVIGIIAIGLWLGTFVADNDLAKRLVADYGYVGIFIVALISGFNLIVPVPAVAFIPMFIAAGLDFWVTILVLSIGLTIADMVAFVLGRAGRAFVNPNSRLIKKLEHIQKDHYWGPPVLMFLYACFVPLPNEIMAIPLGFMGYPIRHVAPFLFTGHLVFNTWAALGLLSVFQNLPK